MQDGYQHERHRLREVERVHRVLEDRLRLPEVALDIGGGAFGAALQQEVSVRQDDRVVVDVDDARVRCCPLGDGVDVVAVRDAGADVEELPDASFGRQVAHRPDEKGSVGADVGSGVLDPAYSSGGSLDRFTVDGEVVRPAPQVVIHPSGVSHAVVDERRAVVVRRPSAHRCLWL
jgi:hypothetical protein